MFRRSAIGSIALVGALGLTACNNDSASVNTPSGSTSTAATSSYAPSKVADPPTRAGPPTSSEAPSTDSTTDEPSPSASSTAAGGAKGSTKLTPDGTDLKYSQDAVVESDLDGKFRLNVKSIKAAPKGALAAANLNEANGKMYYVNFDVTYLGGSDDGFEAGFVSDHSLRPVFDSSEKGTSGGDPYEGLPGCKATSDDEMSVGDTQSVCYYYQVTGPAPTKVLWDDYETKIVWSK